MKKFNQLTEKQMSKTTGGIIFAVAIAASLAVGGATLGGTFGSQAAADK